MDKYPECEKLQSVSEESQRIGFFLEWLKNQYSLCVWQEGRKDYFGDDPEDYIYSPEGYYPDRKSIEAILAEYFQIDMDKVNEEREQILRDIREEN